MHNMTMEMMHALLGIFFVNLRIFISHSLLLFNLDLCFNIQ